MRIFDFLNDYSIPYTTTGKNVSGGWLNITCPHCDDHSMHCGYNYSDDYGFFCWRCGSWNKTITISKLLDVSYKQAKQIVHRYDGKPDIPAEKKPNQKEIAYPSSTSDMLKPLHKKYLRKRGFKPDEIQNNWLIKATGPVSQLDGSEYRHRILMPINYRGKLVSWQTRDVSEEAEINYKACPKWREIIHHKDILYGMPFIEWKTYGFIVEGVFDAWRIGCDAAATFGIGFTNRQLRIIANTFDFVFVMYDPEDDAQRKAYEMRKELEFRGVKTKNVLLETDPADTPQDEMDELIVKLKKDNKL
jgi:hypothetical protein